MELSRVCGQRVHASAPVVALCVVLLGCASAPPATVADPPRSAELAGPPPWFVTPPLDSAGAWYGAGSGSTARRAEASALGVIAQRLQVTVEAEAEASGTKEVRDDLVTVEERFEASTRLRTGAIPFSDYRLFETAVVGRTHYALIAVERARLLRHLDDRLAALVAAIEIDSARVREALPVARLMHLPAVEARVDEALEILSLRLGLASRDEAPALRVERNRLLATQAELVEARRQVVFHVAADRLGKGIGDELVRALTAEGFRVSPEVEPESALIRVAARLTSSFRQGVTTIVRIDALIELGSADGQILASVPLELGGAAVSGEAAAIRAALGKVATRLTEQGGVLGLFGAI